MFKNGLKAIRICQLARNTVRFQIVSEQVYTGCIDREVAAKADSSTHVSAIPPHEFGLIGYYDRDNQTDADADNDEDDGDNDADDGYDAPSASDNENATQKTSKARKANKATKKTTTTPANGDNNKKKLLVFHPAYQQQVDESSVGGGSGTSSLQSFVPPMSMLRMGDKVQFNLVKHLKTNTQFAVNVRLVEQRRDRGFITMLKENYGFIEISLFSSSSSAAANKSSSSIVSRDIFFHFSSLHVNLNELEIGDAVEFTINRKNKQKIFAESVTKLPPTSGNEQANGGASIKLPATIALSTTVYRGKVIQSLRSQSSNITAANINSMSTQEQTDDIYYGKIASSDTHNANEPITVQFGFFSLLDKRSFLQLGDLVTFQLIESVVNEANAAAASLVRKAYNVSLLNAYATSSQESSAAISSSSSSNATAGGRQQQRASNDFKRGRVDSIKGHVSCVFKCSISKIS